MKKPIVSIIILNFNGLRDTQKCIKSLEKTKFKKYEVIIVDNGSDEKELSLLLRKYDSKYSVIPLKHNLGFTGGNNQALKYCHGKYIVLLNNDTVVTPDWLDPLVKTLDKERKVAVAQPKIRMLTKRNYFDYAGAAGGFIDKFGYPFTRGRIFNTKEKDVGQYNKQSEIFWASGAACIIRKSVIKKVGGLFDPIFFNYMEEIDFCWRVWNKGYKVVYCPDSLVFHKGAATSGKNLLIKRYWEHRNNLILLYKNLSTSNFLKTIITRGIFEITTYIHYFTNGDGIYIKSLFQAHKDFIKSVATNTISKNKILERKKICPIFSESVALHYHVLKHKKFSELKWSAKGNISYLVLNSKKSGGMKVVMAQANSFIEKGYYVNIYTIYGKEVDWFPSKADQKNLIFSFISRKPDFVIATFWPTAFFSLIFKNSKKFYFIQDWEENFYSNKLIKSFVILSLKLPLMKIVINNYCLNRIKKLGNEKKRVRKIKLSYLDRNIFNPKSKIERAHNKIKIISVVSWYNKHKGSDILKKVIDKSKNSYKNLHFTLVSFEKKPLTNNVDKFIRGAKPTEMAKLYRNSDICLITSRSEGLLAVGLEAMACGCLVVTTPAPGVIDYSQHLKNSYIINDVKQLWEKNIIQGLMANKKLKNKLVLNGYKTAAEYDISFISNETEKILNAAARNE